MCGLSPDVNQKCAVRSYLLTALETFPTIQMRITIIDGMKKDPVNPVILSEKPGRRR